MNLSAARKAFESGVGHFVTVPPELLHESEEGVAPQMHDLARRLTISLLETDEHDAIARELFGSIKRAVDADSFSSEAVNIASQTFELLSALLRQPRLLDAFDSHNALVTLYFFIVYLMLCANVDVTAVQSNEKTIIGVAILMNRLMLNKQVYETSKRVGNCLAYLGTLCARCCQRRCC